MNTLILIIALTFGILQIILFFKLWGMTNDIKSIKEKYLSSDNKNEEVTNARILGKFKEGDLVVELATDKQMRIKFITEDEKFSCYTGSGAMHVGDFKASEIRMF